MQKGVEHIPGARQRSRVRVHGPGARLRPAPLEDDDGLGGRGPAHRLEEATPVLDAFDVGADDLAFRVLRQVVEQIALVDVGSVAVAHHLGVTDPPRRRGVHHLRGVAAALGDEGHRPRLRGEPRHEGDLAGGDVQPHAVGAHDADPGLHRPLHHLRLQLRQLLFPRLAEAGGEEVNALHPLGDAVVHQGRDDVGGDAGDDVVDGPLDLQEAGVALQPFDLLVLGVDGVDGGEAHVLEADDEPGADASEPHLGRRYAGHGDGAGVKEVVKAMS